jgi:hypothetical protein
MARWDNSELDTKPHSPILIRRELADELICLCVDSLPRQAYDLIGGPDVHRHSQRSVTHRLLHMLQYGHWIHIPHKIESPS